MKHIGAYFRKLPIIVSILLPLFFGIGVMSPGAVSAQTLSPHHGASSFSASVPSGSRMPSVPTFNSTCLQTSVLILPHSSVQPTWIGYSLTLKNACGFNLSNINTTVVLRDQCPAGSAWTTQYTKYALVYGITTGHTVTTWTGNFYETCTLDGRGLAANVDMNGSASVTQCIRLGGGWNSCGSSAYKEYHFYS